MNIIVIDNESDKIITETIERALKKGSVKKIQVGEQAVEIANKNHIDIVFIDITMPESGGMAIAGELKQINSELNIIVVASDESSALEAIQMHCSGYIVKPVTVEKISQELEDLRYRIRQAEEKRVRFQTFGNFEVFIDGEPILFKYDKTKEFLAFLVDRGTLCSNGEISVALWDNDVCTSYIRVLRKDLLDTFRKYDCTDVIIRQRNKQGIRTDLVMCDYYDWKNGIPNGLTAYNGEYMSQYGWAEYTHGILERKNKG